MTLTIAQSRVTPEDPHDCTDAGDELALFQAFYDTLLRREGGRTVPGLAEAWEVSEDARRWTFTLREGLRFHDGTPCDAAAVQANLDRMARPDKGYALGSPAVWRQYLGGADYTAEGRTLTVTLAEPMADFADVLVQGFVVAPSVFARLDAGDLRAICGTGPYRLAEGGALSAEAVTDHWSGPSANPRLTWVAERDPARRLALLAEGTAQVATVLDPAATPPAGVTLHRYRAPVAIIYLLNAASGPLSDPRLRRALTQAVDRPALIDTVLNGQAEPLRGFVSPAHYGAGDTPGPAHDPDAARALIAAAGHGDGLTLTVDCPTRLPDEAERLTAALADQLAAVGIALDVRLHEDREAYAHMVRRKEIGDMAVFDSSPLSTFRVLYEKIDSRIAGAWWQGYANADVEALIDVGRRTPDDAARAALWRRAYGLLQDDPPWLTLYNPFRAVGLVGAHPALDWPGDGVLDVRRLPRIGGGDG
ncbi:peptide ABC transporter substrate-binding protein [Rhodobacteraceae bacterium CCMM004]|nr:peptide ABC transporter substrate-binding protein [Rhodobacteraceae bacterium CCMM004]